MEGLAPVDDEETKLLQELITQGEDESKINQVRDELKLLRSASMAEDQTKEFNKFNQELKTKRAESLIPELHSEILRTSQQEASVDSYAYLKERGHLRLLIQSGKIDEAREFASTAFPTIFLENEIIRSLLDSLKFLQIIQAKKIEEAL